MLDIVKEKGGHIHLFDLTLKRGTMIYKGILGITNIEYEMLKGKKEGILDREEHHHFKLLSDNRLKESFLRSRFICKMSVANYTHAENLLAVKIRYGVFNQPLLDGPNSVSISHSEKFAACIVFPDELPMGLDLETIRIDAEEIIESQLTKEEIHFARSLPEEIKYSYTRYWTTKEALSKVLKTGLTIPFQLLEIEKVEFGKGFDISYFKNFIQYKSITYTIRDIMISLVLPAATNFNLTKINPINYKLI